MSTQKTQADGRARLGGSDQTMTQEDKMDNTISPIRPALPRRVVEETIKEVCGGWLRTLTGRIYPTLGAADRAVSRARRGQNVIILTTFETTSKVGHALARAMGSKAL